MIKANELRIGSCFEFINEEVEDTRFAVLNQNHFYIASEYGYNLQDCVNAIPLTPEILEKAGFETPSNFKKVSEDFFLTTDSIGFRLQLEKYSIDSYYICESLPLVHIQYLHQLQNLFFALTGTELEIKMHEKV